MSRENADTKGRRYLTEGRVILRRVTAEMVDATVRGDGAIWSVTYRRGGWCCDCPARARCSHLVAVWLITAPGRRPTT